MKNLFVQLYILLWMLLLCKVSTVSGQTQESLADSLYIKAIECYKQGELEIASKFFFNVVRINKSTKRKGEFFSSNANVWKAHIDWKLGKELDIDSIPYEYKLPPVDQRLSHQSDSLFYISDSLFRLGKITDALNIHKKAILIESSKLTPKHYYVANSFTILAAYFDCEGQIDSTIYYSQRAIDVYKSWGICKTENPMFSNALNLYAKSIITLYNNKSFEKCSIDGYKFLLEYKTELQESYYVPDIILCVSFSLYYRGSAAILYKSTNKHQKSQFTPQNSPIRA